jgi:DNA-binding transcriptional LysR family regulator
MPKHPRDLLNHNCIGFRHSSSGQVERWEFEKDGEKIELAVNGRLILNDSAALTQAALDGIGIAYMINGYIDRFLDDGRLVRILSDWSPALAGLTLYYADRRRVPAKLRALIDFLRQRRQVEPPQTAGALT